MAPESSPQKAIVIVEKDENTVSTTNVSVSFSTIDIHEHGVILGDNPGGTSGGPPLAVDWEAVAHFSLPIDDYEANRMAPRRSLEALLLPEKTRVNLLKDWGYSDQDIRQLSRPVYIDRARRQATRLKFSNGQRAFDVTVWDVMLNLCTLGCHRQKKREQQNMAVANGSLDDSSQGRSFSRLCQAQDIVLKDPHEKKGTLNNLRDLHADDSTGTLETSMQSGNSNSN